MSWVIEHSKHSGNPFVVLLMIANHAKEDGTGAWPSIPTIAKKARIGERTVQRTIARLVRSGELGIQIGQGPGGTNLYTVKMTGVILTPVVSHDDTRGVSNRAPGGVTAMTPEPSLKQPSYNHTSNTLYKPTLEEVTAYCQERKNSVDPQHWFDYYSANGWKVGGRNSMKDWRASVRLWEKNEGKRYDNHKTAAQLRSERNDRTIEAELGEDVESDRDPLREGTLF